ncbi:MAG TPA: phosphoenolpyruvate carboxykinase, partial [Lactobacillus sp.]|nr:phosphoenolpyruvate carboxykinase [Lactobacillus sp.]
DAVFWIMKDDTLPPVVRIENPDLAAAFGATLATKRSTAENVQPNVDRDQLVIEPFANPFRCYPLAEDYQGFYELFQQRGTACYILNTGFYRGQKVKPADTLDAIAAIADGTSQFQPFGPLPDMSYLVLPTFKVDFTTPDYRALLRKRLEARLAFLTTKETADGGYDKLPEAATHALEKILTVLSESN